MSFHTYKIELYHFSRFCYEKITIATLSNILIRMKQECLFLLVNIYFAFIQDETRGQKSNLSASC